VLTTTDEVATLYAAHREARARTLTPGGDG
jgi:hypothetical protein